MYKILERVLQDLAEDPYKILKRVLQDLAEDPYKILKRILKEDATRSQRGSYKILFYKILQDPKRILQDPTNPNEDPTRSCTRSYKILRRILQDPKEDPTRS